MSEANNPSARVARKLRLLRDRYRYEVRRPKPSAGDVGARLSVDSAVDMSDAGGFKRLLGRHLEVTPVAPAWPVEGGVELHADVDWHVEPHFGVRWPRRFEGAISDHLPGSDLVLLWHKNKMMFLLDLASKYQDTGEERYAGACFAAMDSWVRQNPRMVGKNWRSPMETGTRLLIWCQALSMLRSATLPSERVCERIVGSIVDQAEFLAGHFSDKAIPNNHLIGEAALLYAFSAYWPLLRDAPDWALRCERVMVNEVERQVLADGFDYENAVNYHLYVLDFLLLYLHACVLRGVAAAGAVIDACAAMTDAALKLVSPAGRFPQIGDDSMTDFLALRSLDEIEAARFTGSVRARDLIRPGYASLIENAAWGARVLDREQPLALSCYFSEAGVAIMRGERFHAAFVCGPQHDRPFSSGHMHLDDGSFELEVDGRPVLVDAGTYLYTYDRDTRRYFRSASAHNTVLVDDREPLESERVFGWDAVRRARTLVWSEFNGGALVACERDLPGTGETRFVHRRGFVALDGVWLVVDAVSRCADAAIGHDRHSVTAMFHAPLGNSGVMAVDDRKVALSPAGVGREVFIDVYSSAGHTLELLDEPDDKRCWYSRRYGDVSRGTTVRTVAELGVECRILHVIRRADTSVRFHGWENGEAAVSLMTGPGARSVRIGLDPVALIIDGVREAQETTGHDRER